MVTRSVNKRCTLAGNLLLLLRVRSYERSISDNYASCYLLQSRLKPSLSVFHCELSHENCSRK